MTDAEIALRVHLVEEGYFPTRVLPTGEIAGVQDQLFTAGLFVGLDEHGWKRRYCFASRLQAEIALREWTGAGDPPGPWIKEKPSDRLGPGAVS